MKAETRSKTKKSEASREAILYFGLARLKIGRITAEARSSLPI